MNKISTIILAAGAGTRMKSELPKVLHPICGKPMVLYVLKTIDKLKLDKKIIIIGNKAQMVRSALSDEKQELTFILQKEQKGTGHAVKQTKKEFVNYDGDVLILYGDIPLLRKETILELMKIHRRNKSSATILTCLMKNPSGYGRIIRDNNGKVVKIIEDKDASLPQKEIKEINTGIYCFNVKKLFEALQLIKPNNKQNELYLTDVIQIFFQKKYKISTLVSRNEEETMGINNRCELAQANDYIRKSILEYWMKNGVTIIHPESTFIDEEVKIDKDVVIYPFTIIEGNSIIKSYCKIGPFSYIKNSSISRNTNVVNSIILDSIVKEEVKIGPFSNIRPGTVLEKNVRVGNFCEIKKSHVKSGSKIPHLSYVGDSEIGEEVNMGAGTITCNYDGKNKFKTIIEDNVFIGSNSNLIAPVKIGKNALIAAGSTINKDIPQEALGIARAKQMNILDYRKKVKK